MAFSVHQYMFAVVYIESVNWNNGSEQPVQMRRPVGAFVVGMWHKDHFLPLHMIWRADSLCR